MSRKRNLTDEGITVEDIFEELSSDFSAVYKELLQKLKGEPKYKRLKRVGEEQFYNATLESSMELEQQNTRLCFAKVSLLVIEVINLMDASIHEKLKGNFYSQLKDKVLEAILKLYSVKKKCTQEVAEDHEAGSPSGNSDLKLKEDEKIIFEKMRDFSKFCADNLIDIRKQVIEMPLDETETSTTENIRKNMEKLDDQNETDDENISIVSISSVHTSDLSSFEDEMVLSSDEETGKKEERLTMKEAQERLAKLDAKKLMTMKTKNQAKTTNQGDESQPETSGNDSCNVSQKSLSQRVRKPNSKYITDVILTPVRKKSTEKDSISNPVYNTEQKRGRPRKH